MPEFSFLSKDTPIDPKKALALAQQQALARSLMDEGSKPLDLNNRSIGGVGYAISPFEALGKALQSGLGAYEQKDVNQKYESEVSDYQKAMANALKGGTLDSMIAASAQSPQLMEFGKDLAMSKAKSDYEVNKLMAIEGYKASLDPMKAQMGVYRIGAPSGGSPAPASPLLQGGGGQLPPVPLQPPSVGQMTGAAGAMAGPMNASSLAPPPGSPYAAMGASVPGSFDNTQAAPPPQQAQPTAMDYAMSDKFNIPKGNVLLPGGKIVPDPNFKPTVTGEQAQKQKDAGAYYSTLMTTLDEIGAGAPNVPTNDRIEGIIGKQSPNYTDVSTKINQAHMLMKEMYNLGVLNGPDLALMEQQLTPLSDPRSIMNGPEFTATQVKNAKDIFTKIIQARGLGPPGTPPPSAGGRIKVMTPYGKQGTVDAAHVQELVAAGGKVLQ